jgi:hypothetical protein
MELGKSVGFNDGVMLRTWEGAVDSKTDGAAVGVVDSNIKGVKLGAALGTVESRTNGAKLSPGSFDGMTLEASDGKALGKSDGAVEGRSLGTIDGVSEGVSLVVNTEDDGTRDGMSDTVDVGEVLGLSDTLLPAAPNAFESRVIDG